jgi:hypothetical protein
MKIPKIAHFIWSNKNGLPYSRLLSIATFAYLNPDFKVFYHTFENTGGDVGFGLRGGETVCQTEHLDHTKELSSLHNVEIINHADLHGTMPNQAPTFLSDILRYHLLGSIGGYYFDTDILFYKSMRESYLYSGLYSDITAIISHTKTYSPSGAHRIGVLASKENSRLFKNAYEVARWSLDSREYQSAGSESLQAVLGGARYLRNFDTSYPDEVIHNLLDSFAYKYSFESMTSNLSKSTLSYLDSCFNPWLICVHWYGGALSEKIDSGLKINEPINDKQKFIDHLFLRAQQIVSTSELAIFK